jgi:hypothetical protein
MTMSKLIVLPCVVLLIAAAPSTSAQQGTSKQIAPSDTQQGANSSGGASLSEAQPQEKKICRQLPTSGSRLPNRACLTERQWKQVEEDMEH